MANKQYIDQIEADGIIYEFVDSTSRETNTALAKRLSATEESLRQALVDEINRATGVEQSFDFTKVDKELGKGLSSNDFTDEYKNLIDNPRIMTGATEENDGYFGNVPTPKHGEQEYFLRGDGKWALTPIKEYDPATHSEDGLMSKQDKIKLDKVDEDLDDLMSANITFETDKITTVLGNGKVKEVTFNSDGSITEVITKDGRPTITLHTVFQDDGTIVRTRS